MSVLNRGKLEILLADALKNLMHEFGFDKEEDTILYKYRKQCYDFFSSAALSVNGSHFYKQELIQKRILPVESVWEDLMDSVRVTNMKNRPTITLTLRYCFPDLVNQPYFDRTFNGIKGEATPEGVDRYISIFRPLLTQHLLPAVDKYNDVMEINKVALESMALTKPVQGFLGTQGSKFRRLIIAKLAGDERFEELYDLEMKSEAEYLKTAAEDQSLAYFKNYPTVFREIYKRLKNVPPLENPILQ
jgi:hypothetical protein